jgi:protein-L-isoaspartate(D-aspartate) O-methyltransferase
MTDRLKVTARMKVLEIGTGSGYQTAVLSLLCRRVYSIERYRSLMRLAEARFKALNLHNITTMLGDGLKGWPAQAPFERIIVTAAAQAIPTRCWRNWRSAAS